MPSGEKILTCGVTSFRYVADEQIAHVRNLPQRFFGLRDDLLEILFLGLAQIDGDQPLARGVEIGAKIEHRAVVADERIIVVEIIDQIDAFADGSLQIVIGDAILRVGALAHRDDQIAAVFGDVAAKIPIGMLGLGVHQFVFRLRRAQAMIENLLVEIRRLKFFARLEVRDNGCRKSLCRPWSRMRRSI